MLRELSGLAIDPTQFPKVTMLLCREQLYLAPNRTIARPSKTQGRATQAIQSSIHPGRANPTRLGAVLGEFW